MPNTEFAKFVLPKETCQNESCQGRLGKVAFGKTHFGKSPLARQTWQTFFWQTFFLIFFVLLLGFLVFLSREALVAWVLGRWILIFGTLPSVFGSFGWKRKNLPNETCQRRLAKGDLPK